MKILLFNFNEFNHFFVLSLNISIPFSYPHFSIHISLLNVVCDLETNFLDSISECPLFTQYSTLLGNNLFSQSTCLAE